MTSFTFRLTLACWLASIFSVHCYGDVKINDEYQPIATPKTYAILDISQTTAYGPFWRNMALDDKNQFAFAVKGTRGKDLTVYTWKPGNGAATKAQTIPLEERLTNTTPPYDPNINRPTPIYDPSSSTEPGPSYYNLSDYTTETRNPQWLSADGVVFGNITWSRSVWLVFGDSDAFFAGLIWTHELRQLKYDETDAILWCQLARGNSLEKAYKWTGGKEVKISIPPAPDVTPISEEDIKGQFREDLKWTSFSEGVVPPGDSGWTSGMTRESDPNSRKVQTKTFVRSHFFDVDDNNAPVFTPALSNGMGAAISSGSTFWIESYGKIQSLEGSAAGLNTQNQIIGYSYKTAGPTPSYGAFLFETGRMAYFNPPKGEENALIPKNVRGEIKGLSAFSISNPDPKDGSIRVLLSGAFLIDPKAGTWASRYFVWQQEKNGQIGTITPLAIPDGMQPQSINANGLIAATGPISSDPSGKTHALLLVPFEIRDVRNWSDDTDDQIIDPLPHATEEEAKLDDYWKAATDKNIAWIVAHRDDGTSDKDKPRMPQLEVKFPGANGLKVKWKFKCTYDRGNGLQKGYNQTKDTITIDKTSGLVPADQPWKLHQEQPWSGEFFGGKCELTYELTSADGATTLTSGTARFGIAGKNPDRDRAKSFIGTEVNRINSALGFAYSVAKKESPGYGGSDHYYYNQFFGRTRAMRKDSAGNMVPYQGSDWVGWWPWFPTYNKDDDGPGGYGIFQITQTNVSRKILWNWQDNCTAGVQELNQWRSTAEAWYAALVNTYGEPPTGSDWLKLIPIPNGEPKITSLKGLSPTDAENVVLYNGPKGLGAGRGPDKSTGIPLIQPNGKVRNFNSIWTHDGGGWDFHDNVNHYVYYIIEHIDPDSSNNK